MKQMIISPHVDDEVLGCGGILSSDTFVLHCGLAENQQHGHVALTRAERVEEFHRVVQEIDFSFHLLHHPVNRYNASDLIPDIELYINKIQPDKIYIPHPSYNQDHRAVYEACLTALRPHDINFFVKKVLIYEQPHVVFWNHNYKTFNPNHFVKIDIDKKLHLYSLIETQVRSFRSADHIKAIARVRGGQSGCDHAEAFEIIRWVD
tara:strand:- start:3755 stop:4372 length:618 start_codon:yes stop_codon:yes gene_type:complete